MSGDLGYSVPVSAEFNTKAFELIARPHLAQWEGERLVPVEKLSFVWVRDFSPGEIVRIEGYATCVAGVLWDVSYPQFRSELKPVVWPHNVPAIFVIEYLEGYMKWKLTKEVAANSFKEACTLGELKPKNQPRLLKLRPLPKEKP